MSKKQNANPSLPEPEQAPVSPADATSEVAITTTPATQRSNFVASLGNGLEMWKVHIDDLREQTKNARTMDPLTFKRLVANIKDNQRLEQLPFVAAIADERGKIRDTTGRAIRLELVSGHHRIRAARTAHLLEVFCLVDVSGMTRSQLVSKQLSHNAIAGKDDQDMLAQLFAEMDNLDDMIASAIDPRELRLAEELDAASLTNIQVDFSGKVLALSFLPTQLEDYHLMLDLMPTPCDEIAVLPPESYDRFARVMGALGDRCQIKSPGIIFARMIDIVFEWVEAQPEPTEEEAKEPVIAKIREAKQKLKTGRPATSAIEAYAKAVAAAAAKETAT